MKLRMTRHVPLALPVTVVSAALSAILLTAGPAHAEDRYGAFVLQNDAFLGHDGGGYTNGVFLSSIRAASTASESVAPPFLLQPIAGLLGVRSATLASSSLGQIMITPRDITRRQPDPTDAPYVGALVYRATQVQVEGDVADMASLNLGVIGPASGAKQTQRAIHRLIGSDRPEGWDSQVSNRPLIGLERYVAKRFAWSDRPAGGGASGDVVLQGGGMLGNLESSAGASVLLRYGIGLERSFATTMNVTGRTADPFVLGEGWFAFAGLSADRVFNHTGIGSDAVLRKTRGAATVGVAYGWKSSSLTFSLQSADPLIRSSNRRQSYGSITYLIRL